MILIKIFWLFIKNIFFKLVGFFIFFQIGAMIRAIDKFLINFYYTIQRWKVVLFSII